MPRQVLALILGGSMTIGAPGCAAMRAQTPPIVMLPAQTGDAALMASYVRHLPLGSRVRVSLADGTVIHGTLMKVDADPIVVQRRTRIPESPLQIPISAVRALELEKNNGTTPRTVAIGVAAGVGAALGVLMILAAIFAGD